MDGRVSIGGVGMLALVVVAFTLGGCATTPLKLYGGPSLPEQQIAALQAEMPLVIKAVDGKAIGGGGSGVDLQLLPGRHQVQFGYSYETCFYVDLTRGRECKRFYSGNVVLAFEAMADHQYQIAVASSMTGWQPYIVDETSGRVVAASDREWPL